MHCNPQVDTLTLRLRTAEFCNELRSVLDDAVNILKGTINISSDIAVGDVTYLINNPTVNTVEGEDLAGWVVLKNNAQNCGTNSQRNQSILHFQAKSRLSVIFIRLLLLKMKSRIYLWAWASTLQTVLK